MQYEIKIKGTLDQTWAGWLGEMEIRAGQDQLTTLTVDLPDQAALFGILDHLRDLNLGLVSVNQVGDARKTQV